MNVLAAWQRGFTGRNVVVSILDDGIERTHPDLSQNYVGPPPPPQHCFMEILAVCHT